MKNFLTPLIGIVLFGLYSCSTPRQTSTGYSDDIYFSSKDAPVKKPAAQKPQARIYPDDTNHQSPTQNDQAVVQEEYYDPQYSTGSQGTGSQGAVTNNYYGDVNNFNSDDYYDYSYSARIRRFHQPAFGLAYYDPWYTNAYYYSYDPFMWGTSIYMGYNFWNPRPWGMGMGFGVGYGWGYGGWGHGGWGGGWGYPGWVHGGWGYPGWGWGGGNYWAGYNHGYWNGYNNGLASNYYYNSFDRTIQNTHYGPRSNGAGGGSAGRSLSQQRSIGQLYQASVAAETPRGGSGTSRQEAVRGSSAASSDRVSPTSRGTEQTSRANATERPGRGNEQGQVAGPSGTSRENAQTASGGAVIARPGRDGSTINPNAQNSVRANREASTGPAVTPGSGAATSRGAQVPARERELSPASPNAREGNASPAIRPQNPQTQNPNARQQPQARPNVQPNPSAQPQRGQAGQQQARPQQDNSRQNVYSSPKRNPNAYQPSAQPGNSGGNRPAYDRQPAFEGQQRNSQPQQRNYERQQAPQQRPGYTPSQPQQRQGSPSYSEPSRGNSPSYSAPSRGSSPSYSAPSRGSSPSYSPPSGGGSRGGGGGSAPRGGGSPRGPR